MVLTEKGFKRPTYDELLQRQIERARSLWGEDIDTSEQSVLGKYIRLDVYDLAECYELLEDIYYARFPETARGQSLDRLCTFAGTVRNPATAAKLKVKFSGKAGAVVPMAFLVSGGGYTFHVDNDYTVESGGTCDAYINCTVLGTEGNLSAGTELSIVNPSPDLDSVEFVGIENYGKERESDLSLRIRFNESVAGSGSATVDAIRGAISRVALVNGVSIVENDTEETLDGRPPHSFECYILAPASQDQLIAEAIFSKKPVGIKSIGNVEVQVYDKGKNSHTVRFSRTKQKNIYLKLRVSANQFFETNGEEQIKDSLMEHINNLANGESVYLSSLYGYIHAVHGVVDVQSLTISDDGITYKADNILIGDYEIARTSEEKVGIEVVS